MTCRQCQRAEPDCGFYAKDTVCRDCRRAAGRARYNQRALDPMFMQRERERHAAMRKARPGHDAEKSRRDRASYIGVTRLARSAYEDLARRQGWTCAICHSMPRAPGRLLVDHDHATGEVRGLLCNPCNLMLGHAHDSIDALQAAIDYLSRKD